MNTRQLYETAFITGSMRLSDLAHIRVEGLPPAEPIPSAGTIRVWAQRHSWHEKRKKHHEARADALASILEPSAVEQVDLMLGLQPAPVVSHYEEASPQWLRAVLRDSMADPEQLSSVREIALCDVRIKMLLSRLGSTESKKNWAKACVLASRIRVALHSLEPVRDNAEVFSLIEDLVNLMNLGNADEDNWHEIGKWAKRRSEISRVESIRRRIASEYLTTTEALRIVSGRLKGLTQIIKMHANPSLLEKVREYFTASA